jgi:Uma2 family endonuclease
MSTAVEPRKRALTPESRFVIYGLDWKGYDILLDLLGDQPGIHLAHDRGSVELMKGSQDHEQFGSLLGRVIDILTEELYLPCICVGQMTWRREILDRGLEADDCFYLANASRVLGKKIDLSVDPPPDLAIEVEISRSALDRMGIYAALRVPEIWRYDGETLRVELLQPDGTYAASETSLAFPFLPLADVVRFLQQAESMDHGEWRRQFRGWVRDDLVPRVAGERRNDANEEEHP